jgi:hypothetical protein
MVWKVRINKTWGLFHIDFLLQNAMKERVLDI